MPDASDDQLMEAFRAGDEQAFEALYDRHAGAVAAFVRRMTGNKHTVEDLVQTTFLAMVRARGRYEPGTNVRAWLFTIAANAARDLMRRNKVRGVDPHAVPEREAAEPVVSDPAAVRLVESALAALPETQREAVLLHKFQGFSFQEIARILGITESTAKVRAHRGYQRLRNDLAALEEER